MDDVLKRLENKLDRLDDRLDRVDVTLTKQHGTLTEHIRRTEIAEANIERLDDELEPVKTHVAFVGMLGKVLGAAGTLAALVVTVLKLAGVL